MYTANFFLLLKRMHNNYSAASQFSLQTFDSFLWSVVVLLSFGTNVNSHVLSQERIETIFKTVSQLPYTIIWKWSDAPPPGFSPNIHFRNWIPQTDVLAHPKLKLFITHAGQGSVAESLNFGKPMVLIPLFAEQFSNAKHVESKGFGKALDFHKFTGEQLKSTIIEVYESPYYRNNTESFAKIYNDRPLTPRESVLYWTEYVLRHNGAKHMQSLGVHLNFWQLYSLDVMAFLILTLSTLILLPVALCKLICCNKKSGNPKSKVN